jgi:catechol 2,3-dioxygenase-like lactoylglutathione lyase family enzyme
VQWIDPPTTGETFGTPAVVGLHALTYAVPAVADRVRATGVPMLGRPVEGLLRPGTLALLVRDPDGVLVELVETRPDERSESRGVRLSCRDLDAAIAWYNAIGFTVEVAPTTVNGAAGTFGAESGRVRVRAARMSLVEEPTFALTIVEWPDASRPDGVDARHRGLFRMALRVENVNDALAVLAATGVAYEGPKWIPMPGTKIGGLTIAFLHDPDGTLVELVERPVALVGQPAIRT